MEAILAVDSRIKLSVLPAPQRTFWQMPRSLKTHFPYVGGTREPHLTFNTYIALIRMRSKRFTSIVLQYDLEI